MGGKDDVKATQTQVAGEPQAQGDQAAAQQMQVTSGADDAGCDDAARARAGYEAALAERDARIAALGGEIAEAAKAAESAEIDELRRQGEEQRVDFELQMAGPAKSRQRGRCSPTTTMTSMS